MPKLICALVLALAAAALLYFFLAAAFRRARLRNLREECQRKLRMAPPDPESALKRHIKTLQEKFPGKGEAWYLEKILHDLDRDRR